MITDLVKGLVEDYYKVELNKNTRLRTHVEARAIYFKILRDNTKMSLESIGRSVGRDHATVLYAQRKLSEWLEFDAQMKRDYETLESRFKHAISLDKELAEKSVSAEGFYEKQYKMLESRLNDILSKIEEEDGSILEPRTTFEALDTLLNKYNFLKSRVLRVDPKRIKSGEFDLV